MENFNIKIELLPSNFKLINGKFNKVKALNFCGKIAGVCYNKEEFNRLKNEPKKKTDRRINQTINSGHHSVYDHVNLNLNLTNIPKILAMVLNNEKQYTTAEKSARYTKIERKDNSIISLKEEELYNKWTNILKDKIKNEYGNLYNDTKIEKLAGENARYFVTVFMPTTMVYTTSFRQLNYIASFMENYIENCNIENEFERKLSLSMLEFVFELSRLNILDERLMKNEKYRTLSLFNEDIENKDEYSGNVYSHKYYASFASLAQAQRHRTINYQMKLLSENKYYVPKIIRNDESLVEEWLKDMESVKDIYPIGSQILISEEGTYENFILKCKERLCTNAQLEICDQTKDTLNQIKDNFEVSNHPLLNDVNAHSKGSRCTFPDFDCTSPCKNIEGKKLIRRI